MQGIYQLPATLEADLEELRRQIAAFKAGELSPTAFRSFRVPQGVYEQRQDGTFMLRIRLPGGSLLPHQMRGAASVARQYGVGRLHVTTRQDLQVHKVPLDGMHPALVALRGFGLSTKGGGGNTVRNVMACPDAGVCPKEVFDVAPHSVAMTEFMLADPVSYQLPRKYKIAFSGCGEDCIGATVNDVGFIAKETEEGPGFAVYAGGGMGARSRTAQLLEEFVPIDEAYLVAEAVKRVFDKHGNRKNKHRARLRFVVEEKGFEGLRALYREELARLRKDPPPAPVTRDLPAPVTREPRPSIAPPADGFEAWRHANVFPQKQEGYYRIHLPLRLGEIPAKTMEALAGIVETFGEGMVRATPAQNLLIRWVPETGLPDLHRGLSAIGLADAKPPVLRDMIACTGTATCRLGICLSPGLASEVENRVTDAGVDLAEAVDLKLHINGCPNACGRHPIASIGLSGKARRVGERLVPHYTLQFGGRVGEGVTRLADGKTVLPARTIPTFLVEFLRTFRESSHYPDFDGFLANGGRAAAADLAAKYKDVPPFTQDRNYYYDWGSENVFTLAGRGAGECSAGVFDLILVDLGSARTSLDEGSLLTATTLAARALLITRGEEAKGPADVLRLFTQHFLDTGIVGDEFRALIAEAGEHVATGTGEAFDVDRTSVADLITAVETLYENMDQSLRFRDSACAAPAGAEAAAPPATTTAVSRKVPVDREADFQGVTCPLNYVKTKMLLAQMAKGQVLSVLLDDAGGKSVPPSAQKDGHEVVASEKVADRWRVLIRKG